MRGFSSLGEGSIPVGVKVEDLPLGMVSGPHTSSPKLKVLSKYKETGGGKTLSMVSRASADNSHHTQGTPIRQIWI